MGDIDKQEQTIIEDIPIDGLLPDSVVELVRGGNFFKKNVTVVAVLLTEPTFVSTVLMNGLVETERLAPAGSYVITNPDGEEYAVSGEKFLKRYALVKGTTNVYNAVGVIRAIQNPYGKNISILASWGEFQHGGVDCWLAVPVETDERPYIIGGAEFDNTYVKHHFL